MAILSLGELPGLKRLLAPLGYTIHVHDACGGQAFELERTGESPDPQVFVVLEAFFANHKMKLTFFGTDRLNFVAK